MNKLAFIQSTHFLSCFLVIESYHKLQGISFSTINFVFDLFELFNVTVNDMGIFMTSCKIREGDTSYLNNAVWVN